MKIRYTEYGLANNFGNYIELNKDIKKDKVLHDYIIKNEKGHNKGFSLKDFLHEFDINIKVMPKLILFVLVRPKTWIDFSPIQYRNKQIIYDSNMIILYLISLVLLFLIIKK